MIFFVLIIIVYVFLWIWRRFLVRLMVIIFVEYFILLRLKFFIFFFSLYLLMIMVDKEGVGLKRLELMINMLMFLGLILVVVKRLLSVLNIICLVFFCFVFIEWWGGMECIDFGMMVFLLRLECFRIFFWNFREDLLKFFVNWECLMKFLKWIWRWVGGW